MVAYSYNMLSYARDDGIEPGLRRLAEYGYDGAELVGEPDEVDVDRVTTLLDAYDLAASSICGLYTRDRDLTAADPATRTTGIRYVESLVAFAHAIGASVVVVRPGPIGRIAPQVPDRERAWAIEALQEVAAFVEDHDYDVTLGVEPWNRYETHLVNTIDEALELLATAGVTEVVGVWADLFHMAIEEASPARALRRAGDDLVHVHVADTNCAAPGQGHYDYRPIIEALKDVGYDGYLTFDLFPASARPFDVLEQDTPESARFHDRYTRESIEFFRPLWERY